MSEMNDLFEMKEPLFSTKIKTIKIESNKINSSQQQEMKTNSEIDYEMIPNHSTLVNASAGTLAGIAEHCVMYPIDSIKTRYQVLSPISTTTLKSNSFNLKGLWKGVGSMFVGAGPAHAIYYGSYEYFKRKLKVEEGKTHGKEAFAGTLATILSETALNPFDVIKQRMQVQGHNVKNGMINCGINIMKKEGPSAFFISLPTTLIMNIPFNATHFIVYEYYRKKLNPTGKYDPKSHVIAGALAGGIASIITNPLDVSKTLLQLRGTSTDQAIINANGLWKATKIIYKRHGLMGFTKGMTPRILYNMPSTAISWTTYEFCKWFIQKNSNNS